MNRPAVSRILAIIAMAVTVTSALLPQAGTATADELIDPALLPVPALPDFTTGSFWISKHNMDAPDLEMSETWIQALQRDATSNWITLTGLDSTNQDWDRNGAAYYFPQTAVPPTTVTCPATPCYGIMSDLTEQVRFPQSGGLCTPNPCPSNDHDSEITIGDRFSGNWVQLWMACPPNYIASNSASPCQNGRPLQNQWTAHGGSLHVFNSDGLDNCWFDNYKATLYPNGNDANTGHRGFAEAYEGVRYQQAVTNHLIPNVLRVAVPDPSPDNWFPMVGSDGSYTGPPEGAILRLKSTPLVNGKINTLSGAAKAIAVALRDYGAVVADGSGGPTGPVNIKLENLVAENSTYRWVGLVTKDSLSMFTFGQSGTPEDYEFVKRGDPSPVAGTTFEGKYGPNRADWVLDKCEPQPPL